MAAATTTILTFVGLAVLSEIVGEGFFRLAERVHLWIADNEALRERARGIPLDVAESFVASAGSFTNVPAPARPRVSGKFGDNLTEAAVALYGPEKGTALSRLFFSSFGLEAAGKSEGHAFDLMLTGAVPLLKHRSQRSI